MFLEKDYWFAQQRHKDALAWAEKERLIREILAERRSLRASGRLGAGAPSGAKGRISAALRDRYQRWMARVGARLIRWGNHLQARYADTMIAASAMQQECCGIESRTRPLASQ